MKDVRSVLALFGLALCLVRSSAAECSLAQVELLAREARGEFKEAYEALPAECKSSSAAVGKSVKVSDFQESHVAKLKALGVIQDSIKSSPDSMIAERVQDLRKFMQAIDVKTEQSLLQGSYVLLDQLTASSQSVAVSPLGHFIKALNRSAIHQNIWQLPLVPTQTLAAEIFAFVVRCALLVTLVLFVFWRLWPREGIQISFEEITAEPSKKPVLDRVLMQDVQQAFWIPRTELTQAAREGLELAPVKDNDAAGFGSLVPQRPMIPWSDVVQSGTPIRLGPVSFDLKQLLSFLIGPLQIRRRHSLIGFLHESEERTLIMAQQVDWKGRQLRGRSWKAEQDAKGTRHEMINDLAAQIIVDLRVSSITTDWKSYRAFCKGLNSLSTASAAGSREQCQCIESARELFQIAISFDPSNWIARFYLAVCLCRCNENESAVSHFLILERVLSKADLLVNGRPARFRRNRHNSSPVVAHIQQYPQCPFLVLYNKAMALSGTFRSDNLAEALSTIQTIRNAVDRGNSSTSFAFANCASLLSLQDRCRFAMLALSAQASIQATQIEYLLRSPGNEAHFAELSAEINRTVTCFNNQFSDLQPELLSAHALAHATILNAQGRAEMACFASNHQRCSEARVAQSCFEEASACMPDLIDSHINIIKLLLLAKASISRNWIADCGKRFKITDRLDPENIQARYLRVKFLSTAEINDFDGALTILGDLPTDPETFFLRAEILSNASFSMRDIAAAIAAWHSGTSLLSEPSQAEFDHLLFLFEFTVHNPELSNDLCPVAVEAARRLSEGGKCTPARKLGTEWLERLTCQRQAA